MLPLVRGGNEITEEGRSLSAKIKLCECKDGKGLWGEEGKILGRCQKCFSDSLNSIFPILLVKPKVYFLDSQIVFLRYSERKGLWGLRKASEEREGRMLAG